MSKFLNLVRSGWFVALVGLLFLAIVIWLGGPYLGIGQSQPLASPVARLSLILLMVVAWAAWLQIRQLRGRQGTKKMSGDLAGQDAVLAGNGEARSADERIRLRERFQEAIDTLRKTRRGGGNLYALPWYVVIGPPGSGKSTLLQNSGLNFPLSDRFGKDAVRGIGGTRNCDWWFTDEAVFLDTAGRYTMQDSDGATDASAWQEFLKLLCKYRRRRPLNGVIVTMSMADLLVLNEAGRQAHVRAVRRRLDELAEYLRIGVPVYLVFTKCDLIAGFGEFFEDLNAEARSQVWGVSFPIDKTTDGGAAGTFGEEFDLLLDRLDTRVLGRLHAERNHARRSAILSFPQQLGAMRDMARQFVEGVFSSHAYGRQPLLRGAYFTSGTQEGAPIDRMMGAVARTFGVDTSRLHTPGAQRRTFFVERLLKEVLFPESGFAGTDPKLERRKIALQAACYIGIALVSALLFLGIATSYGRNRAYVAQVDEAAKNYPVQDDLTAASDRKTYFARVLQRLEALASTQEVARQYDGHVPLLMRFGLYQGDALGEQTHEAYIRDLNGILLPGIAAQFRDGVAGNAGDPQALYAYLKGYLMLGEPAHRRADELEALARIEWRRIFPQDPQLQQALAGHFHALANEPGKFRAIALDEGLVSQARATLRAADLSTLVYGSLKLAVDSAGALPVKLDETLGLLGNVFRRKSGAPLSEPLPGLFTQPVFATEAAAGIGQAVHQFAEDDWVFGTTRIDVLQQSQLTRQVLALYQQDYIKAWDGLLDDLALQTVGNIQDASAMAAKLSGPSSPLKALLKLVRDNTSDMLRAPPPDTSDKALAVAKTVAQRRVARTSLAREIASAGVTTAAPGVTDEPGREISEHFAALDKLGEGTAGATPIDHTLGVLDQLSKTLLTMTDFSDATGQASPALLAARQEVAQLPPPLATLLDALTGQSVALVASGTSGALVDQFRAAAGNDCASFTRGRYPFDPTSTTDIPLQNFGELFGNGGRFDMFFKQSLARLVDTGGTTWHFKAGPGAVGGPPGLLAEAQLADDIRQAYFRGGNQPEVDFIMLAPKLDPAIGKLVIVVDGQKVEYPSGSSDSTAMKWPGPQPGHVTISESDANGASLGTLDYQGDWALFRALQAAHLQRQSDLRFVASFNVGGHIAEVTIQASSLKHPFLDTRVQRFRCGA